MKSYPSFDAYLEDQPAANQSVIRALRKLVKRAAPSLEEAVKYGNGCWVDGKWPIAYVYAAPDHTQFGFMAGSKLKDPKELLAGGGAYVRHVKLRTARDFVERDLVALLDQAVALGHPAAKPAAKAKAPAGAPRAPRAPGAPNAERQLASHFAKYSPAIAKFGKALRAKLRKRLPGLNEIVYVYANQGVLLITYSATEQGYEGLCSIGLYPDEVRLSFGQGAALAKSAPKGLLQGSGKTVRYVVLTKPADVDRADIAALMGVTVKLAKVKLRAGAKGKVIVKAEEQKARAATGRGAKAKR
ncbi:MAG: DUF1801 domain-containing protein [Candidatus Eisenbacteria bacterium]|uniref:DUF1801 domain-containing protein n=1 Tax=Eiseniibacteriota bacterium TaxID=2212470 RepID=A0A933SD92_UNCEI|nr:DUF1801 domain-containing protein [Candidatus Eisenbacteria bacterium]